MKYWTDQFQMSQFLMQWQKDNSGIHPIKSFRVRVQKAAGRVVSVEGQKPHILHLMGA